MVTETDGQSAPELTFEHPDSVSLDDQIPLVIDGLPMDDSVTVALRADDYDGREWTVRDTYSISDGRLQLHSQSERGGAFGGGVAAAVQRLSAQTDDRFHTPPSGSVRITVEQDGRQLGSTTVTRTIGDPDVTAREIDHQSIHGTVFEPPATGAAPGVVVLHGSGGQPDLLRGRLLASHGFHVAAIQYFGADEQPDSLVGVSVETVAEAVEYLRTDERTTGSSVGLVGTSKGGELALLAGAELDSVGAVVSINGSGVAWEGIPGGGNPFPGSSWTIGGNPVDYVPYAKDQSMWEDVLGSFSDPDPPFEYEPAYSQSLETADQDTIVDATIPVESIDGPVLLVSGGADRMWDSVTLHGLAAERLASHDHDFEHLVYDDAGHAISVPYQPTANRATGQQFVLGGTATGYARADRDHWPQALETLSSLSADHSL